jgi:hypothetical protein
MAASLLFAAIPNCAIWSSWCLRSQWVWSWSNWTSRFKSFSYIYSRNQVGSRSKWWV